MPQSHDVCLFFAAHSGKDARIVQQRVERVIEATEVYRSIQSLSARLKQSIHDIIGAVLIINDAAELDQVLAIEGLLRDLSLIILLNKTDRDMAQRCHRLRPRLIDLFGESQALEGVLLALYHKHQQRNLSV